MASKAKHISGLKHFNRQIPKSHNRGRGTHDSVFDSCLDNITSTVILFADDTIIYIALKPKTNTTVLQEYLHKFDKLAKKSNMQFNLEKCYVIPVTRNKNVIKTQYMLHGQLLEIVSQAKYIGITITSDLRWNARINNSSLKANRSLRFLRRNFKNSGLLHLCQSYLRNQLYSLGPLHLYTDKLEMIQRRAARYVLHRNHNTSSVTDKRQPLGWRFLSDQRNDAKL